MLRVVSVNASAWPEQVCQILENIYIFTITVVTDHDVTRKMKFKFYFLEIKNLSNFCIQFFFLNCNLKK
jgi:hypothetical protein